MSDATVRSIYRHPVKGMTPEPLEIVTLRADQPFPGDRLFAVENGPSGFDPEAPAHIPKIRFLTLARNEKLATLRTRYDDEADVLTIDLPNGTEQRFRLAEAGEAAALEHLFEKLFAGELRGPVRLLRAPDGHRFMDSRKGFVSLLNLASVEAITDLATQPIDPRRFRANLHVDGLEPWTEFEFVDRRFRLGEAVLAGIARIDRCAATDVDPDTGARDTSLVRLLETRLRHHDCGVYCRVEQAGVVRIGDRLTMLPA